MQEKANRRLLGLRCQNELRELRERVQAFEDALRHTQGQVKVELPEEADALDASQVQPTEHTEVEWEGVHSRFGGRFFQWHRAGFNKMGLGSTLPGCQHRTVSKMNRAMTHYVEGVEDTPEGREVLVAEAP